MALLQIKPARIGLRLLEYLPNARQRASHDRPGVSGRQISGLISARVYASHARFR